jgi:hypothetical protein
MVVAVARVRTGVFQCQLWFYGGVANDGSWREPEVPRKVWTRFSDVLIMYVTMVRNARVGWWWGGGGTGDVEWRSKGVGRWARGFMSYPRVPGNPLYPI